MRPIDYFLRAARTWPDRPFLIGHVTPALVVVHAAGDDPNRVAVLVHQVGLGAVLQEGQAAVRELDVLAAEKSTEK